jgi:hypothetical protein
MGILIPGTTSWLEAIPVFVVALVLLFTPGLVAARIMRLSVLSALVIAPVLTTTCVAVGGVVAEWLGVRWGVGALAGASILLWLFSGGVRWGSHALSGIGRRVLGRPSQLRQPVGERPARPHGHALRYRSPTLLSTLAGLLVAFVIVGLSVFPEIRTPEAIPQHPDTIFHLGAAQWMLESGSISSLTVGQFQSPDWTGFYPAAFHGFTATIAMLTGSSVVVATECFVLVVGAVAWPLGCIGLALTLLGRRPAVALVAAVVSVAFTGFPYFLMGFGVLWPNLFGQALLPAALATLLAIRGSLGAPRFTIASPATATWLLAAALPALVLAHPSALIGFGLFATVALLGVVGAAVWRRRRAAPRLATGLSVATVITLGLFATFWTRIRPNSMVNTGAYGPEASARYATKSLLEFAPRHTMPLTLLSLMTGIGVLVILVRHRGARWVVTSLGIMLALFWLNVAVDTTWVRHLTWPWYNNAVRIQAVAVLPAVIAASAGLLALPGALVRVAPARLIKAAPRTEWSRLVVSVGLLTCFLIATGVGYLEPHRHILHRYFHPKPADSWVSDQELQSLRHLSNHLPPDAVVAANPWNGGTYLYIVSGRRLLVPTEKTNFPGDRALLSRALDKVGADPAVCAAAERQRVNWAITGGQPFSWAGKRVKQYVGVDSVGSSPAWRAVASSAPYTLYERTGCAQ